MVPVFDVIAAGIVQPQTRLPHREPHMAEFARSITILAMGSVVVSAGVFVVIYG